jgi:hypothetical protein
MKEAGQPLVVGTLAAIRIQETHDFGGKSVGS